MVSRTVYYLETVPLGTRHRDNEQGGRDLKDTERKKKRTLVLLLKQREHLTCGWLAAPDKRHQVCPSPHPSSK